jgi:hypothetical protein
MRASARPRAPPCARVMRYSWHPMGWTKTSKDGTLYSILERQGTNINKYVSPHPLPEGENHRSDRELRIELERRMVFCRYTDIVHNEPIGLNKHSLRPPQEPTHPTHAKSFYDHILVAPLASLQKNWKKSASAVYHFFRVSVSRESLGCQMVIL